MTTKLLEALTLAEEVLTAARNAVDFGSVYDACGNALAAIREQKAELGKQAEQEPVAWMQKATVEWIKQPRNERNQTQVIVTGVNVFDGQVPLYATPVQQVDLTDEQWTQSELFKLAVSRGLITLHTEFVAAPVDTKTKVSWMEGRATSCDISNEAARAVIAADREKNK